MDILIGLLNMLCKSNYPIRPRSSPYNNISKSLQKNVLRNIELNSTIFVIYTKGYPIGIIVCVYTNIYYFFSLIKSTIFTAAQRIIAEDLTNISNALNIANLDIGNISSAYKQLRIYRQISVIVQLLYYVIKNSQRVLRQCVTYLLLIIDI